MQVLDAERATLGEQRHRVETFVAFAAHSVHRSAVYVAVVTVIAATDESE
jgi:hypothetical protein